MAPQAFAISRVGTCGVEDTTEGFKISEVPSNYREIYSIANSGVKLSGMPRMTMGFRPPARILIYPLRAEFPEILSLDRSGFIGHFKALNNNWSSSTSGNPCIETLTITNGSLRTTLAAWGEGRGLVIQSEFDATTDSAVKEMLLQIELQPGACRW